MMAFTRYVAHPKEIVGKINATMTIDNLRMDDDALLEAEIRPGVLLGQGAMKTVVAVSSASSRRTSV